MAQPTLPTPADIFHAVATRYSGLAASCTSLGCGDALDLADPRPGEVVVDLGCGRGRDVIRAAGRVGPAGRAIGIDATEAMLAAARASVPPAMTNVRFVKSDLADLDLGNAFADVVVSSCSINHAPDKEAVYREIRRILRPGGRFVVADIAAERELPASIRTDPVAWAECLGGAIPERDLLAAIERAGFPHVEILRRTEPYERRGVPIRSLTLRGIRSGS